MIDIEKTRTVALSLDEISRLVGLKDNEKLHLIKTSQQFAPILTASGQIMHELKGDLLFLIIEPIKTPR